MKKTIVYVDGYNLYYGRLRNTTYKWLNLVSLFQDHILKAQDPSAILVKIKYFTARALGKFSSRGNISVAAQTAYHRAIETLHSDSIEIILGKHTTTKSKMPAYREGEPLDRKIYHEVWRLEEKQTDVNIAITMYRDVMLEKCGQIVICSNDSDLEPVLRLIREDSPNIKIGLVVPLKKPDQDKEVNRRVSASLCEYAHWTRHYILDEELEAAQLPNQISTKKKPIKKPDHW